MRARPIRSAPDEPGGEHATNVPAPNPACELPSDQRSTVPDKPVPFTDKSYRFGTLTPHQDQSHDHAVVKLAHAIPGAKAFGVDSDGPKVEEGQTILVISEFQQRMPRKTSGLEPIVQECTVRAIYPPTINKSGGFLSDCSATGFASGSLTFVRSPSGNLVPAAILESSGGVEHDHKPFNIETKNFTKHLILNADLLRNIEALAKGKEF